MKKITAVILVCLSVMWAGQDLKAQTFKVGVFDIDLMVQAMPGYRAVDSLTQIYNEDSLAAELEVYKNEFARLDSIYKIDSALFAQGKQTKQKFDYTTEERRKVGLNLVYWQQIASNKSNAKRNQYAQGLYEAVVNAYKKVLDRKKYTLILKPQTYEAGSTVDNIFLAVARELKLTELPQQLLGLGLDPDAPAAAKQQPAGNKPANGTKPKN